MNQTRNPQSPIRNSIVVGTRGSPLAQWQAQFVIAALKRIAPDLDIELRIIKTRGDRDQTRPLAEIGGRGVFTKEIEIALLAHEIDLAVHSLKDLPTDIADGLMIAAILEREDPRDCLISRLGLGLLPAAFRPQLPHGARVGTSSTRRKAQLLALRPDLQIVPLRGNVDTRLRKACSEEYDAVVLAAAGVIRLGRAQEITEYLPFDVMLPDPGQGALAVEIRAEDAPLASLIASLDHAPTRAAVTAERAFLRALGGGCRMPIAAYGEVREGSSSGEGRLHLRGLVASLDGAQIVRAEIVGDARDAEDLGVRLAAKMRHTRASTEEPALPVLANRLGSLPKGSPLRRDCAGSASAPALPPLRGRRILVTRAQEQAESLAEKIRTLGGEPVEFPTIAFAPLEDFDELDDALAQTGVFDWIIFTSANGVRFVAERLQTLGLRPRVFAAAKLAAIGPATARALEELGLRVDFVPTRFLGEQIASELPVEPGQRALLLHADIASEALARGLATRGVTVMNVSAYRTIMPPARPVDLSRVDAVTFTSSSTVRNFVAMLDDPAREALARIAVFCIGPVTAETARGLGLHVDAVATEHTMDGLIRAIVEYFGE